MTGKKVDYTKRKNRKTIKLVIYYLTAYAGAQPVYNLTETGSLKEPGGSCILNKIAKQ